MKGEDEGKKRQSGEEIKRVGQEEEVDETY
jgi:hypothetical protein